MRRKLKIAQIAPIWYSVPPKKYGGIERIAHFLTEGLVKNGHNVTLFASGDSKTKAKLISLRKKGLAEDKVPWSDSFWEMENLSFAFDKAKDFDIIHCHVGLRALFFQNFSKAPVVHTFHNPIIGKAKKLPIGLEILHRHRGSTNACFISKSAKSLSPIKLKNNWVVYNGIDLTPFKFNQRPKDYFLWAGRMDPYKGIENVIKVAKQKGLNLYLVGKIDKQKQAYFKEKIKPHFSSKIRYSGEVSQKELAKLYRGAIAFLYPIEWEEPFGLVMVEAMACGTPVIAFERGSVKELVKSGKNGFSVPFLDKNKKKNLPGFSKAIDQIKNIKRLDCRKWVEDNFTIEIMVKNYEKVYYELLSKKA